MVHRFARISFSFDHLSFGSSIEAVSVRLRRQSPLDTDVLHETEQIAPCGSLPPLWLAVDAELDDQTSFILIDVECHPTDNPTTFTEAFLRLAVGELFQSGAHRKIHMHGGSENPFVEGDDWVDVVTQPCSQQDVGEAGVLDQVIWWSHEEAEAFEEVEEELIADAVDDLPDEPAPALLSPAYADEEGLLYRPNGSGLPRRAPKAGNSLFFGDGEQLVALEPTRVAGSLRVSPRDPEDHALSPPAATSTDEAIHEDISHRQRAKRRRKRKAKKERTRVIKGVPNSMKSEELLRVIGQVVGSDNVASVLHVHQHISQPPPFDLPPTHPPPPTASSTARHGPWPAGPQENAPPSPAPAPSHAPHRRPEPPHPPADRETETSKFLVTLKNAEQAHRFAEEMAEMVAENDWEVAELEVEEEYLLEDEGIPVSPVEEQPDEAVTDPWGLAGPDGQLQFMVPANGPAKPRASLGSLSGSFGSLGSFGTPLDRTPSTQWRSAHAASRREGLQELRVAVPGARIPRAPSGGVAEWDTGAGAGAGVSPTSSPEHRWRAMMTATPVSPTRPWRGSRAWDVPADGIVDCFQAGQQWADPDLGLSTSNSIECADETLFAVGEKPRAGRQRPLGDDPHALPPSDSVVSDASRLGGPQVPFRNAYDDPTAGDRLNPELGGITNDFQRPDASATTEQWNAALTETVGEDAVLWTDEIVIDRQSHGADGGDGDAEVSGTGRRKKEVITKYFKRPTTATTMEQWTAALTETVGEDAVLWTDEVVIEQALDVDGSDGDGDAGQAVYYVARLKNTAQTQNMQMVRAGGGEEWWCDADGADDVEEDDIQYDFQVRRRRRKATDVDVFQLVQQGPDGEQVVVHEAKLQVMSGPPLFHVAYVSEVDYGAQPDSGEEEDCSADDEGTDNDRSLSDERSTCPSTGSCLESQIAASAGGDNPERRQEHRPTSALGSSSHGAHQKEVVTKYFKRPSASVTMEQWNAALTETVGEDAVLWTDEVVIDRQSHGADGGDGDAEVAVYYVAMMKRTKDTQGIQMVRAGDDDQSWCITEGVDDCIEDLDGFRRCKLQQADSAAGPFRLVERGPDGNEVVVHEAKMQQMHGPPVLHVTFVSEVDDRPEEDVFSRDNGIASQDSSQRSQCFASSSARGDVFQPRVQEGVVTKYLQRPNSAVTMEHWTAALAEAVGQDAVLWVDEVVIGRAVDTVEDDGAGKETVYYAARLKKTERTQKLENVRVGEGAELSCRIDEETCCAEEEEIQNEFVACRPRGRGSHDVDVFRLMSYNAEGQKVVLHEARPQQMAGPPLLHVAYVSDVVGDFACLASPREELPREQPPHAEPPLPALLCSKSPGQGSPARAARSPVEVTSTTGVVSTGDDNTSDPEDEHNLHHIHVELEMSPSGLLDLLPRSPVAAPSSSPGVAPSPLVSGVALCPSNSRLDVPSSPALATTKGLQTLPPTRPQSALLPVLAPADVPSQDSTAATQWLLSSVPSDVPVTVLRTVLAQHCGHTDFRVAPAGAGSVEPDAGRAYCVHFLNRTAGRTAVAAGAGTLAIPHNGGTIEVGLQPWPRSGAGSPEGTPVGPCPALPRPNSEKSEVAACTRLSWEHSDTLLQTAGGWIQGWDFHTVSNPDQLKLTNLTSTSATLTWKRPTNASPMLVLRYKVLLSHDKGKSYRKVAVVSDTSITLQPLATNTMYHVSVTTVLPAETRVLPAVRPPAKRSKILHFHTKPASKPWNAISGGHSSKSSRDNATMDKSIGSYGLNDSVADVNGATIKKKPLQNQRIHPYGPAGPAKRLPRITR